MSETTIRAMTASDWPEVEAIYAAGIQTGHATFEPAPPATWEAFDTGKHPDLRPDALRQGLGGRLLAALIEQAEQLGVWTIQCSIFPENAASIRLHERHGFRIVGIRERIAYMSYEAFWVLFRFLCWGRRHSTGLIIGSFGLYRSSILERFVQALRVPPVHPPHRLELDLGHGRPRRPRMDQLGLVEPVHSLRERVVVTIPTGPDRCHHAGLSKMLGVPDRYILRPAIRVVHQPVQCMVSRGHQRMLERLERECFGPQRRPGRPPHNLAREHIDHERRVAKPCRRPHIGDIRHPQ